MGERSFSGEDVVGRLLHTEEPEIMPASTRANLQGYRDGYRVGLLAGSQAMVLKQLRARFGALPLWAVERVEAAGPSQVDVLGDRLLTAATIDEVFAR
jgi:hypothetical protein